MLAGGQAMSTKHEGEVDAMLRALRRVPRDDWAETLRLVVFCAVEERPDASESDQMAEIGQAIVDWANKIREV